jgi:hypothetical protein
MGEKISEICGGFMGFPKPIDTPNFNWQNLLTMKDNS